MSLFGSLFTAVSGLNAQAAAFSNISDNVANSQTVGFKETNTAFIDYLTTSSATVNEPGAVVTRPEYSNDVQGAVSASTDATALAISGGGFFAVKQALGIQPDGTTQFADQQNYTRSGDFTLDQNGYLKNNAGGCLQGWTVNPNTGIADQTQLNLIKVSNTQFNPIATSTVSLSANLPVTPSTTTTTSSQVEVYDALGTQHLLNVNWTQNATNDWTATITAPDNTGGTTIGSADVKFGASSGNSVAEGTIGTIGGATGAVAGSSYSPTGAATLTANVNFGSGVQPITVNLGNYGSSNGVTQFAGTTYDLRNVGQNGEAAGTFSGITITGTGNVVANYDNGQTRTLAQIPIETFASPDSLQRQSNENFTASINSGTALAQSAATNQAGSLVVGSTENSNVDIAAEFSKLIVAQQAYGANSKVITTASDLLTQTIDMKR